MASAAPCTGLAPAPRAALLAPTDDRRPLSRTAGAWLCLVIAALPELPRCVISPTTIEVDFNSGPFTEGGQCTAVCQSLSMCICEAHWPHHTQPLCGAVGLDTGVRMLSRSLMRADEDGPVGALKACYTHF